MSYVEKQGMHFMHLSIRWSMHDGVASFIKHAAAYSHKTNARLNT